MAAQLLPVSSLPNQTLAVTIAVDGQNVQLNCKLYYNRVGQFWAIDVYDSSGIPIVLSVPFVTGYWPAANIMAPFNYLKIGSWYIISQNGATTDMPTDQSLGTGFCVVVDDSPN